MVNAHSRRPVKLAVIVGTRPEAIKLAPVVIAARQRNSDFTTSVINIGQHIDLASNALESFGVTVQHELKIMQSNQSPPDVIACVLNRLTPILRNCDPDVVLVQGDTSSALASAMVAHHCRIPVAHVEAGLRTADRYSPFPEEMNRRLITRLATYHFAPTNIAKRRLLSEGINASSIVITGNSGIDALRMILPDAVPPAGLPATFYEVTPRNRLLLFTCHRRESDCATIRNIATAVCRIVSAVPDLVAVCPVHPSPRVLGAIRAAMQGSDRIVLLPPLDYRELIWLMHRAAVVVTDSGGIQEEAPTIGTPVAVVRDTTERDEAIECGAAVLVGTDMSRIFEETVRILARPRPHGDRLRFRHIYGDGYASEKMLTFIADERRRQSDTDQCKTSGSDMHRMRPGVLTHIARTTTHDRL